MDHGSHTFYLAFEWLRGHPLAISATASTLGPFDTEDNLTCAVRFPNGMASVHLTWTAGMRKVIYTIHGSRGAIRVEDDDLEVTSTRPDGSQSVTRSSVRSEWMNAGHPEWFASLFLDFASAIDRNEYVGPEAIDSLRCVEAITAAYALRGAGRARGFAQGPSASSFNARDRRGSGAVTARGLDLGTAFALVAITLTVGLLYLVRVVTLGATRHERVRRAGTSPLFGRSMMEAAYWVVEAVASAFVWLGISANAITALSLASGFGAGILVVYGHFGLSALAVTFSSMADALDGVVARKTGTSSEAGEIFDAAVDRYVELFFLGGVALYVHSDLRMLLVVLAAILGSFMVSYSTAKAEALRITAPRGAMRRAERAVVLFVGAVLTPFAQAYFGPSSLFPILGAIAFVAIGSNVSAVRRLRAIARSVRERGPISAPDLELTGLLRETRAPSGETPSIH